MGQEIMESCEYEILICKHCLNYIEKRGKPYCKEKLTVDELFSCWNNKKACGNFKDAATAYIESRIW